MSDRILALALALVLALPGTGLAATGDISQHLRAIKQLLIDTEYERALDEVRVARRDPHGQDEDVTLSLYEGILLYELRRKDEAREAFLSAFRQQLQAELPVPVSPKVQQDVEAWRQQAKQSTSPPPVEESKVNRTLLVGGGVLLVAGGVSIGISQIYQNRLVTNEPPIQGPEEASRINRVGKIWENVGFGLVGLGAVALAVVTSTNLLKPSSAGAPSVGLSTDGTSAILYGRWP